MSDDQHPTWDDVRFWAQILEDSRRTLICPPDLESRVKTRIAAMGLDRQFTVMVSPYAPDGAIYLVDLNGMDADTNQSMLRAVNNGSWA